MAKRKYSGTQEINLSLPHDEAIKEIYSCKFHKTIAIGTNLSRCIYVKKAPSPFDTYYVSEFGDFVVNEFNGYVKLSSRRKDGYRGFNLFNQDTQKMQTVSAHRLVALTFIPVVDGKNEVDHINRIRKDNRVCNLRWANREEQMINRDITKA